MTTGDNQRLQALQGIFQLMQNPPSGTIKEDSLTEPYGQLGYKGIQEDVTEFIAELLNDMEKGQPGSTAIQGRGNENIIFFTLRIDTLRPLQNTLLRQLQTQKIAHIADYMLFHNRTV
jgi:hypothetical protein